MPPAPPSGRRGYLSSLGRTPQESSRAGRTPGAKLTLEAGRTRGGAGGGHLHAARSTPAAPPCISPGRTGAQRRRVRSLGCGGRRIQTLLWGGGGKGGDAGGGRGCYIVKQKNGRGGQAGDGPTGGKPQREGGRAPARVVQWGCRWVGTATRSRRGAGATDQANPAGGGRGSIAFCSQFCGRRGGGWAGLTPRAPLVTPWAMGAGDQNGIRMGAGRGG